MKFSTDWCLCTKLFTSFCRSRGNKTFWTEFWTLPISWHSKENTPFRKLELFPSSGGKVRGLLHISVRQEQLFCLSVFPETSRYFENIRWWLKSRNLAIWNAMQRRYKFAQIKRFKPDYYYRSAHGPFTVHSRSSHGPFTVRSRSAHGPLIVRSWSAYLSLMVLSCSAYGLLMVSTRSIHDLLTVRSWSAHVLLMIRLRSAHGLFLVRSLSLNVKQNILPLYLNTSLGNRTVPWLWSRVWTLLMKHGEEYLTGCWLNRHRPYSYEWGFRVTHFLHQTLQGYW